MSRVKSFFIFAGASLVVGCASQRQLTPTATGAGHEVAAAASPAAVPRTASAAPGIQSAKPQVTRRLASLSAPAVPEKDDAPLGYDRVIVHGKKLYCRTEGVTGSRLEKFRVCLTPDQLQAAQAKAKGAIEATARAAAAGGQVPLMCGAMGSPSAGCGSFVSPTR